MMPFGSWVGYLSTTTPHAPRQIALEMRVLRGVEGQKYFRPFFLSLVVQLHRNFHQADFQNLFFVV